jgi:hypothetical protein
VIINARSIAVSVVAILTIVASEATFARDKANSTDLLADSDRHVSLVENKIVSAWQKVLVFEEAEKHDVAFRAIFQVENPTRFTSLMLKKPLNIKHLTLNDKMIPKPMEGMTYDTIPGIPVSLLEKGSNELQATWTQQTETRKDEKTSKLSIVPSQIDSADIDIRLFGLMPSALTFQTGPVLGYAGQNFFTVTCRVNIPSEVVLETNNRQYVSKPALLHSFKAEGLTADTQYHYSLKARLSSKEDVLASIGPYSVRTMPVAGQFSFAVLGDSRTHPKDWAKVAAAVVTAKPAFSVFVGDMVTTGRIDSQWDEQYFSPARNFFATIPYYGVIGNHEQNCPLFTKIFPTPGGKNWSQAIGSVLFIGIDGDMDWSSGSKLAGWLEDILAKSKAKFIFLASHYPPWTSGDHGLLNENGRPRERSIRLAQDVLMPLLKKYNATAMFAGHDHFYERSEPEEGVSMIVTGGAGAPLRNKANNPEKQNPYSKVFAKEHHYCLLTINKDVCAMKVLTPEGTVIDTRSWTAREGITGLTEPKDTPDKK